MDLIKISSLSPLSSIPSSSAFTSIVTLLWPFSSATGQCALLLADPDFRLRYQKGQVRVRFAGPSARAIAKSGVGIGDEVELVLDGARWLSDNEAPVKTPGRGLDGELIFDRQLNITVRRNGQELRVLDLDESTPPASPDKRLAVPSTPTTRPLSRVSLGPDGSGIAIYSSPAFMKRLRLSEASFVESPRLLSSQDEELDTTSARKRRRVSYKNVSQWRFDDREPSPEKEERTGLNSTAADMDVAAEDGGIIEQVRSEVEAEEVRGLGTEVETARLFSNMEEISIFKQEEGNEWAQARAAAALDHTYEDAQDGSDDDLIMLSGPPNMQSTNHTEATSHEVTQQLEPQVETPSQMPPPPLPRLDMPPSPFQQINVDSPGHGDMTSDGEKPTTPRLMPVPTEGLPLPSPFPTSAKQLVSPSLADALADILPDRLNEPVADLADPAVSPLLQDGQIIKEIASDIAEDIIDSAGFIVESSPVAHPQDVSEAAEVPVSNFLEAVEASRDLENVESSLARSASVDSEASATVVQAIDLTDLKNEDSDTDASDFEYDETEIARLQESDESMADEEPDYDNIAKDLKDELHESLWEEDDNIDDAVEIGDNTEESVLDESEKELYDQMIARSDDDEADDIVELAESDRSTPDIETVELPESMDSDEELSSSEASAAGDFMSQPLGADCDAGAEQGISAYPYGLDGSMFSKESESDPVNTLQNIPVGDGEIGSHGRPPSDPEEEAAWEDRESAIHTIHEDPAAQPQSILGQRIQASSSPARMEETPFESTNTLSASAVNAIELLSDSEEEDQEEFRFETQVVSHISPQPVEAIDADAEDMEEVGEDIVQVQELEQDPSAGETTTQHRVPAVVDDEKISTLSTDTEQPNEIPMADASIMTPHAMETETSSHATRDAFLVMEDMQNQPAPLPENDDTQSPPVDQNLPDVDADEHAATEDKLIGKDLEIVDATTPRLSGEVPTIYVKVDREVLIPANEPVVSQVKVADVIGSVTSAPLIEIQEVNTTPEANLSHEAEMGNEQSQAQLVAQKHDEVVAEDDSVQESSVVSAQVGRRPGDSEVEDLADIWTEHPPERTPPQAHPENALDISQPDALGNGTSAPQPTKRTTHEVQSEKKRTSSVRKSVPARISEVPSVISAWFSPRRSSRLAGPASSKKDSRSAAEEIQVTPSKAPAAAKDDQAISTPLLERFESQGTSTSLAYFHSLTTIAEQMNQPSMTVDVLAISASDSSQPTRAKGGPRDFYTAFHVIDTALYSHNNADPANGKSGSDGKPQSGQAVRVEVYRPWKASLPSTSLGDVILLRNFVVKSQKHKPYLLSSEASSWCVWRYSESVEEFEYEEDTEKPAWARKRKNSIKEEIKGPPVDVGLEEREKVAELRAWWETLQNPEE